MKSPRLTGLTVKACLGCVFALACRWQSSMYYLCENPTEPLPEVGSENLWERKGLSRSSSKPTKLLTFIYIS